MELVKTVLGRKGRLGAGESALEQHVRIAGYESGEKPGGGGCFNTLVLLVIAGGDILFGTVKLVLSLLA